jgi:AbrB family looped-hinge helix DNA binding protein
VKAIQKIVLNGNSAQITIPRPILFKLNLRPGELVEVSENDDGIMRVRPFIARDDISTKSPGVISPPAPVVPR